MTSNDLTTPPRSFWIISSLLLVWNLLGLMVFAMQATMTDEAMAALPEAQQALYSSTPSWVTAAFAVAVFGGTLGCVFLLLKKSWAVPVFVISLAGILAQNFHSFFMSDAVAVFGTVAAVAMPLMVIAIAVFLIWYSRRAQVQEWIG